MYGLGTYSLSNNMFLYIICTFLGCRNSLVKQPQEEDPDEGVKDLVELVLRKLDYDKDGKVSFPDFHEAVSKEPLFLEAFGQCLPSEPAAVAFLATLS